MAKRNKRLFDGKTEPYTKVRHQGQPKRLHRIRAEEKLGRSLLEGEVVHHKDGDPTNNDLGNLQVLASQRHHALLEHYQRRERRGIQHLFSLEAFLEVIKP